MEIKLHNKIEIKTETSTYTFYNTMLQSTYDRLKTKKSFNSKLAIGNGENGVNLSTYKLSNQKTVIDLETDFLQNKIENGTLYIKKTGILNSNLLNNEYITEIGLAETEDDDTTIYDYFYLVDTDHPNGILKEDGKEIAFSIYIYLTLTNSGDGLFTKGDNPFVSFLLGNGLNEDVYAVRGKNLSTNTSILREVPDLTNKEAASFTFQIQNGTLNLNFSFNLGEGETYEIVFLIGEKPFARINTTRINQTSSLNLEIQAKTQYALDVGIDVDEVTSVKNKTLNIVETDYVKTNYADSFGDKIALPFNNLFSSQTPRFLSKDGDKIFFVLDNHIYGYKFDNYKFDEISTNSLIFQNISKIVSFDNFLFIITKTSSYIYSYYYKNGQYVNCTLDLSSITNFSKLSKIYQIDCVQAKNNKIMLGIIFSDDYSCETIYLTFDSSTLTFSITNDLTLSDYEYKYLLAIHKNNFSDAEIMYLKPSQVAAYCITAFYKPDATMNNNYTAISYYFSQDMKNIYVRGRAVISEKTSTPPIWIYYFPQKFRYNPSILSDVTKCYFSTDLHYFLKKDSLLNYKIYNLIGYNTPTEFEDGFPTEIDEDLILDFEFVGKSLLIFYNNDDEQILAYNFHENKTVLENIETNTDLYQVNYTKYNLIGHNLGDVTATIVVTITI